MNEIFIRNFHLTILSLCRYDHETDEDFLEMTTKETEVIEKYKLKNIK